MSKLIDLTGKKFGRWTVVGFAGRRVTEKSVRMIWECMCECGNKRNVPAGVLMRGGSKSCGCLKREGRKILPRGIPERNLLLRTYKKNAELRGLEFSLTAEQFVDLMQQDCFYCGAEPKKSVRGKGFDGKYAYNGIDRVNNSIGYTLENCVSCCETCNKAKLMMSEDEFAEWVVRVYHKFALHKKFWTGIYVKFQEEGISK